MKKIGFIDLFIDEWHANNYPQWFKESAKGKDFTLALAWEEGPRGGRPLTQWCAEMGIPPARSMKQVVEECDAICILAPSNPEVHEHLADLPLRSGKPVYLDKPFAPDRATAERLFALAHEYRTPLMSSSALRYGNELRQLRKELAEQKKNVRFVGTLGGGSSFQEYGIHQVEMIVSFLGMGAKRVMQCGGEKTNHMVIGYDDDRRATVTLNPEMPFTAVICHDGGVSHVVHMNDIFENLIADMLEFFAAGTSPIDYRETIEISTIVAAGNKALSLPGKWVVID